MDMQHERAAWKSSRDMHLIRARFSSRSHALFLLCARESESAKKAQLLISANDESTETSHPNFLKGPLSQWREKSPVADQISKRIAALKNENQFPMDLF
jgi:hypothetical protein